MSPSQRMAFMFGLVAFSVVVLYYGIELRGSIFSLFLIIASPILIGYSIYQAAKLFSQPETPVEWSVPYRNNMDGPQYDFPTSENPFCPNLPSNPKDWRRR